MKPKVLKVKESNELIPTAKYPHAKFYFEFFNPPQSRAFEYYDKDVNFIAAVPTATGKTVIGEMTLANTIREQKKKGLYLAPYRALSQERIDDWTGNHHFNDLRISICTGDYKLTAQRKKELEEADLIVMTSEMLNSRARNYRSETNNFLKDIGSVIIDEFHTISQPNRGDHIESAIMKFTEINSDARLALLSATADNVEEIGRWISTLNGKDTYVLQSNYRSCPLKIHYVKYQDVPFGYEENERLKVREAVKIVERHSPDKFILFVHTKKTGDMLVESLRNKGIVCEFHNADLIKDKRVSLEKRFREDQDFRCVVATSTLAAGINMPARRVVVVGVNRGLTEVDTADIFQQCGRAGRPQYDPQGDAYILLPQRSFAKHKERLEMPQLIQSQMKDSKCLAFHLTSEVHHRNIQSLEDIHDWYERSLAHHQANELDEEVVADVMKKLARCGAVKEEEGTYETTIIGNVASMFYFSPFDISDLSRNWTRVFDRDKETNDYWVAMALGNIDGQRMNIASNADKEEMSKFCAGLNQTNCEKVLAGDKGFTDGSLKIGCCYFNLLKGYNSAVLGSAMRGLQMDFERVSEVLCAMDQMAGRWGRREYFRRLYLRILYGVEEEMVSLCCLKGIGKIKAKRLWDANLRTYEQISSNVLGVIKALNCSKLVAEGIANNAKELLLV